MFRALLVAATMMCGLPLQAMAGKLSCRSEPSTYATICFNPADLRKDGDIRKFVAYVGGAEEVRRTDYTGYAGCSAYYLELRNRQGIAVSREIVTRRHLRDFIDDVCAVPGVKNATIK